MSKYISKSLKLNKNLKKLDLSNNKITFETFKTIFKAFKFNSTL